jgi:hypothetical protein
MIIFHRPLFVGVLVVAAAVAVLTGRVRETSRAERIETALLQSVSVPASETVDFNVFAQLPPPVERYFRHVLTDRQKMISRAEIRQNGVLRTSVTTENWSSFTARHLAVPPATGFAWNARVDMPLATHVRVLDNYIAGRGSGHVSLLSTFPVAAEAGTPELNAGALHRYLAEAVWYPTALLPQSGVEWSPIDNETAIAKLTNSGTSVSLEFRFNEAGEVAGIYTPRRFGRFDGEYRQLPWEGHFRDYQIRAGMRIPLYGEVGWYDGRMLQLVWKGNITETQYEFQP